MADAPTDSDARLAKDCTVEFCGLLGRAELNGKIGIVLRYVEERDRYAVYVDEFPQRQDPVLIRRANLKHIADPGSAERFHSASKRAAESGDKKAAAYRPPPTGIEYQMPITITGLKSELNGCVAAVTGWNAATGCLQVLTCDHATELSLKPENCIAGGTTFPSFEGDALLCEVGVENGDSDFGECFICQDARLGLISPFLLCCGQAMCNDCGVAYSNEGKRECPFCRAPFPSGATLVQRVREFCAKGEPRAYYAMPLLGKMARSTLVPETEVIQRWHALRKRG
jgi:hypothetical protein